MDKQHHLILKTHNTTNLKYLCYHYGTEASCYKYRGSGKYWKYHLIKHGNDVDTTILESSHDKNYISEKGVEYSNLWGIVQSEKFANLIIEDAQKTAASIDYKTRHINKRNRILENGYTDKELNFHRRISKIQTGKTMQERLGDPNWVDPRKGKTFKEIYGDTYIHPRKGKRMKDIPRDSEPFRFIINECIEEYYKSEKDFEEKTGMSRLMISKIKKKDQHTIIRQSNTKHNFKDGDIVKVIPISIEDYKMFVR